MKLVNLAWFKVLLINIVALFSSYFPFADVTERNAMDAVKE